MTHGMTIALVLKSAFVAFEETDMTTWINGSNGNRASIEYWGSEDAARASMDTLKNCSYCSDCSDCSRCSGCSGKKDQTKAFIVPVIADIHRAVFEAASQPNALNMDAWHTCNTTHCRAGWVVTLAGEEGKMLETETSTLFAALQIYKASDPENPVPPTRFFDSNDAAMADMARLAKIGD